MSYIDSTVCKMLATHCVCCGRPLVDAVSVELGMGPECRKEYDAGLGEEQKKEANKIVHAAAVMAQTGHVERVVEYVGELEKLGFGSLASKVGRRFKGVADRRVNAEIVIEEVDENRIRVKTPFRRGKSKGFVQAWRKIPGRRWEKGWNYLPKTQKKALWDLLVEYFPGKFGDGPKGVFRVPSPARFPKQLEMKGVSDG